MLTGFFMIHSVVTSELLYEIFISPFNQKIQESFRALFIYKK